MKKRSIRRLRVTSDLKLQLPHIFRISIYWLGCLLTVAVLHGARLAVQNYPMTVEEVCHTTWKQIGPAMLASLFFLPVMLVDGLVASNRLVGPMVRVRDSLKAMAKGAYLSEELKIRKGDFYADLVVDLNRVNRRLLESQDVGSESSESESSDSSPPSSTRNEEPLKVAAAPA